MFGSRFRRSLVGTALAIVLSAGAANGQSNPRHEELKQRADTAYRSKDFDSAVSITSEVLRENPRDAVAHYLRASARVEQGIAQANTELIREGIEDARQAIRLDAPKKPDYYLPYLYGMSNLTKYEGKRSHAETAVTVATQVLTRPNLQAQTRANVVYQRGVARIQLEQFPQAVSDFRRTLEASPEHLGARMALSDALLKTGDAVAAEESLNVAVTEFPSSPVVFNNRGMFYQSRGEHEKAIGDFTQAVGINPQFVQAYLNRGFTLIQSGDAEAAVADFDFVLGLQPENASAFSLRGTARLRHGDAQSAIPDYTRAVELDPANAAARADLGFAYFFVGDYATAAAGFDQSLALKPDNVFLHPWRYVSLARSGQQAKANREYQSLTTRPIEQQSWFDALTLLLMRKLTEEEIIGRVESRDVKLKDAQICEAYYFIGVTKQADDPEQAAAYFRRALRSQAKQLSAYQAAQIALDEVSARQ